MFIYAIILLLGLFSRTTSTDVGWEKPNAWAIHSRSPNVCPVCDKPDVAFNNENSIVTMYYKQMVIQLFDRNALKVDPKSGRLGRSITLFLTPTQLDIIENSSDIEIFNSVVTSVLADAKDFHQNQNQDQGYSNTWESLYSFVTDIVKSVSYIYVNNTETRFLMLACAVTVTIWFIHKRYNKNLIFVLIFSCLLFGYFCTYLECNRKLQTEELIEFIEETEPGETNFLAKIFGKFFKLSKKQQKIERIRKESKVRLGFCRPDDVAVMYFNQMFFKQIRLVVEQITDSMKTVFNEMPFPFNWIGMMAIPGLFMSLMPLLFKYIFNPISWHKYFQDHSFKNQTHQFNATNQMINNNEHQGDRLSGDNLKLLFEVLKQKTIEETPKNSAVEDVKDAFQAVTANLNDSSSAIEGCEQEQVVDGNKDVSEKENLKKDS